MVRFMFFTLIGLFLASCSSSGQVNQKSNGENNLVKSNSASTVHKGGPPNLIGTYLTDPKYCRMVSSDYPDDLSWQNFRKDENKVDTYYEFCDGTACIARIISYEQIGEEFILEVVSRNNPSGSKSTITRLDKDFRTFSDIVYTGKPPVKFYRCPDSDG